MNCGYFAKESNLGTWSFGDGKDKGHDGYDGCVNGSNGGVCLFGSMWVEKVATSRVLSENISL